MKKLIYKIFKDVFTDPSNKNYSYVLILGTIGFFWLITMETRKFGIHHIFNFLKIAEGLAFYLGAIGGVHTVQYGIKKLNQLTDNQQQENKNV